MKVVVVDVFVVVDAVGARAARCLQVQDIPKGCQE
jgi:hypothetical protein